MSSKVKIKSESYYVGDIAKNYDSDRKSNYLRRIKQGFENRALNNVLEKLDYQSSLLDVPCGTGRFLPMVKSNFKVEGCDISQDMIDNIPTEVSKGVGAFHIGQIGDLPFENDSYDYLLCMRFMNLFPVETSFPMLSDMLRVSKKGVVVQIRFETSFNYLLKFIRKSKQIYFRIFNRDIAEREKHAPDGISLDSLPSLNLFKDYLSANGYSLEVVQSVATFLDSQKICLVTKNG